MKKICIIGLGNMGQAMMGILNQARNYELKGCDVDDDLNASLEWADVLIVAVKPQNFMEVCDQVRVWLKDKLVISIMAGISLEKIEDKMRTPRIVRVMPNLALKVQESVSAWIASKSATDEDKKLAREILGNFGDQLELEDEKKIDAITALSGSGPAYFYYLTEILEEAAKSYGFSGEEAKMISQSTFLGSSNFLFNEGKSASELKQMVSSKGGTTEAALKQLKSKKFDKIFLEGIEAARKKAEELNN